MVALYFGLLFPQVSWEILIHHVNYIQLPKPPYKSDSSTSSRSVISTACRSGNKGSAA